MYENILDSGHHIFPKGKYIFRGDICDMRRLWGLVGGLAKPLRLALLLLLSGQPLTGLLIRMRKVVMMGVNVVLIPLLLFLSIKVVTRDARGSLFLLRGGVEENFFGSGKKFLKILGLGRPGQPFPPGSGRGGACIPVTHDQISNN